jgi:hypothetical protein
MVGREFDEMLAILLGRKAVEAIENRYDYKGLSKRCRRVCRHFQLLYLRWEAGDPA